MNFRTAKDTHRALQRRAFDLEVDAIDLIEALIEIYLGDPAVETKAKERHGS